MSIKLQHSGGNAVSLSPPTAAPTSAEVAFKLPNADGSAGQYMKTDGSGNLAFAAVTSGISEYDQWYLTATKSDNSDVTANLSRVALAGCGAPLGTGMSQSSGIFTFPSTGKYLVVANAQFEVSGNDNCILEVYVTTNNSSYTKVAIAIDGNDGSGIRNGSSTAWYFLDVTDTSNVKIKFATVSLGTNSALLGAASGFIHTGFHFAKLGDT